MNLEETQPHIPMSPENSSSIIPPTANSADRATRREPPAFMRLEQDIDQGKFDLSPDIQIYANNILQAQYSGQLNHGVWVNTMASVHNVFASNPERNWQSDDYRFAGNIILRACQEREDYLASYPNERQVGEDDAIEAYRAIARDYYLKRTSPEQDYQDSGENQRVASTLDVLLMDTGIILENLPDHVQTELKKYNIVIAGSSIERAVADRLFNYLFGLDRGVIAEEQLRQLLSNAAQIKEGYVRSGDVLEKAIESGGDLAAAVEKGMDRSEQKRRLTPSQEYDEFLKNERWLNLGEPPMHIDPKNPPAFWLEMTPLQKEVHRRRIELARVVFYKRTNGVSLEKLSENEELRSFSKTETELLYRYGKTRQALEYWIKIIDNPGSFRISRRTGNLLSAGEQVRSGDVYTLYESQDQKDVDRFRKVIVNSLYRKLLEDGESEEGAIRIAIDSEQIAFNLVYIANTHESLSSQWQVTGRDIDGRPTGWERLRPPSVPRGEIFMMPVMSSMNPLDQFVSTISKPDSRAIGFGKFSEWGRWQLGKALSAADIESLPKDVAVRAVASESEGAEKWWTLENVDGRLTLYVPDCYPVQLLGSVWEEFGIGKYDMNGEHRVQDSNGEIHVIRASDHGRTVGEDVKLIDYLRSGVEIPWDKPGTQDFWLLYTLSMGQVSKLWKYYTDNELNIHTSKFGGAEGAVGHLVEWMNRGALVDNLGNRGLGDNSWVKRWIVYASVGVKKESRLPLLNIPNQLHKDILVDVLGDRGEFKTDFLPRKNILFPWEKWGWWKRRQKNKR